MSVYIVSELHYLTLIGQGMKYKEGGGIRVGDEVSIDMKYSGTVVADIGGGEYAISHAKEQWRYLKTGVLIDTDFGGLVHYEKDVFAAGDVKLLKRAQ